MTTFHTLIKKNQALKLEFLVASDKAEKLPQFAAPEIALVGRSNVGKSSLFNFLSGKKELAKVSKQPGRTQSLNLFTAYNGKFYLMDLPGYGFAKAPEEILRDWQQRVIDYLTTRANLKGILFLVDCRREPDKQDKELVQWLQQLGLSIAFVQTKADKVSKGELFGIKKKQAILLGASAEAFVSTSSSKNIGREELYASIIGLLSSE